MTIYEDASLTDPPRIEWQQCVATKQSTETGRQKQIEARCDGKWNRVVIHVPEGTISSELALPQDSDQ